ncbi:MAG: filamentous hemagglutinin N-terminal domain-containing protein [Planctomycetaceae bacterium]|jgi:filamentous hemagglutinin family protein|nr:filamentous hemagglutinin N-terminal domain-containing protein [Planctomycetaceae bacterium]
MQMTTRLFKNLGVFAAFSCSLMILADVSLSISPGDMLSHTGGVSYGPPSGNVSNIDISAGRAAIDWSQFHIGAGETANFNFSDANGAVLNRVTGLDSTQIHGMLNSNGAVFVVNQNGMVIGSSARINAKAFVGSTLGVTDAQRDNFLNGGAMTFEKAAGSAVLENNGAIRAGDGSVILLGTNVVNNGDISAANGSVELLAGRKITATLVDPAHPVFAVNAAIDLIGGTGITQTGTIEAVHARLEAVGGNIYALAINNSGTIRANSAVHRNGRILLVADHGNIRNTGVLQADGTADNPAAGQVEIRGENIEMDFAKVTATGDKNADNGIHINGTGNVRLTSTIMATTNADIDINAAGHVTFETRDTGSVATNLTMVNAYGTGDVTVKGADVTLASFDGGRVSVGSRLGTTSVTSSGNILINSESGGFSQIGYHYYDTDSRILDLGLNNSDGSLYFARGNIDVRAAGNLGIRSDNSAANGLYLQGSLIGHAILPKSLSALEAYPVSVTADGIYLTGGDINILTGGDVSLDSNGRSVAQIGHYVQGNYGGIYTWKDPRIVLGNINVDSYGSVKLKAANDGYAGIGHSGDYLYVAYELNDNRHFNTLVTASRDIILEADNGGAAQIGYTMFGEDSHTNPGSKPNDLNLYFLFGNVQALAGENIRMTGNGSTVIGHTNRPLPGGYSSVVVAGYAMNRLSEITDGSVVNPLTGTHLSSLDQLKARFNGEKEGALVMDSGARIGREVRPYDTSFSANYVSLFGWRMMRDNQTSAMQLADGAVLSGVTVDSTAAQGVYTDGSYRYALGAWPGAGHGLGLDYDFEHYGYTYADYIAGHLEESNDGTNGKFAPGIGETFPGKWRDVNLSIFYPASLKTPDKPEKPETPGQPGKPAIPKYEKPYVYWPAIPVWFNPPCCCRIETTCEEYTPKPCEKVRRACDPACQTSERETSGGETNSDTPSPTLAPPQEESATPSGLVPIPVPPKPVTVTLLTGR